MSKPKKTETLFSLSMLWSFYKLHFYITSEKDYYNANCTVRFKIIKRHETELKWIKSLQAPFPKQVVTQNTQT